MLKSKVLAIGAGGNNAGIGLLKLGLIEKENILLVNSTAKDIPAEYEVLNESHDEKEKGIQTIRITDGELDYEYTIGKDCVPIMMTITNHFSSELITKTEYSLFTNKFEYGDEFLIPVRFECWYSLHPYDTYIKNPRDTLYADFPDDIFTLEFLENL